MKNEPCLGNCKKRVCHQAVGYLRPLFLSANKAKVTAVINQKRADEIQITALMMNLIAGLMLRRSTQRVIRCVSKYTTIKKTKIIKNTHIQRFS